MHTDIDGVQVPFCQNRASSHNHRTMAAGLPDEIAQRLKKVIRDELLPLFADRKGPIAPAAEAIGVNSGTLHRMVNKDDYTGSYELLQKVAAYLGKDERDIAKGTVDPVPALRDLPTWRLALRDAKSRIKTERRAITAFDLARAGLVRAAEIRSINGALLVELASSIAESSEPEPARQSDRI